SRGRAATSPGAEPAPTGGDRAGRRAAGRGGRGEDRAERGGRREEAPGAGAAGRTGPRGGARLTTSPCPPPASTAPFGSFGQAAPKGALPVASALTTRRRPSIHPTRRGNQPLAWVRWGRHSSLDRVLDGWQFVRDASRKRWRPELSREVSR